MARLSCETGVNGKRVVFISLRLKSQIKEVHLEITDHAQRRMSQRGMKLSDIDTIMKLGCKIHRTGIIFYILRKKDIPAEIQNQDKLVKLEGATLLVNPGDGTIIICVSVPTILSPCFAAGLPIRVFTNSLLYDEN